MLTRAQIRSIQDIIRRRFIVFTYEALGEQALTADELDLLKKMGIIRSSVRHMTSDSYTLGKLVALLPRAAVGKLTLNAALKAVAEMKLPTTEVEKKAMDWAAVHAGEYIRGLRDDMIRDVGAVGTRSAMTAARNAVSDNIRSRESIGQLKTKFMEIFDNRYRDWERIAHTEVNTVIQQGVYDSIRSSSPDGDNQLVYKRPSPGACVHCKRVYLHADGITPRVFRLGDLEESNIGRKAASWGPTIGSVHPWCFTDGRTPIFTSKGWKKIRDVKIGDLVLTHRGRFRRVSSIMPSRRYRGGIVEFRVSDGNKMSVLRSRMRVTENHEFYTSQGWKRADELKSGMTVKCLARRCANCNDLFLWTNTDADYCSKSCASVKKASATHTPEVREKLKRENLLRKKRDWKPNLGPAHEATRQMLKDGTHPFLAEGHYANRNLGSKKTSFLEKKVEWLLSEKGVEFKRHPAIARIEKDKIGRQRYFFPDFQIMDDVLIECDGSYRHDSQKDSRRDCELSHLGYRVVRFTEDQIRNRFAEVSAEIDRILANHNGEYEYADFEIVDYAHYQGSSQGLYDFEVDDDHSFVASGVVSHNCRCQLMAIPDGFDFVKKKIVKEPFELAGRKYKPGQIVEESEYRGLPSDLRTRVGDDTTLTYTGRSPAPIKKSEIFVPLSEIDHVHDEWCDHD